ncbi:MAG TPA: copper chaperone PCu(A)C [Persephonella sp.]|uniref:PeriplasmiC protein conserved in bacteria with histidine n=1 Tax=Persephonella marina (strain DSM 14350 / EX-H1) TaxID=123214 RepID=C0QQU1_PERMH|nr:MULTISPECIES: copper chaperone PCu(A)C [Persephonella]ACO03664.1 periplasmiC protein conserved in bacteria with histidine [Persephonella marina EX-H1]HCB68787.1 copper chaperone PCu(A)C [Persephonella sp.]
MVRITVLLLISLFIPAFSQPEILIKDPWVRAVPPTMNMTAGYMVIENKGDQDDYLIGIESDISKMADLHVTVEENNVVKMKHIKKLKIPARSKVELKPGGYHIMFMKLNKKLLPGKKARIILIFEKSGKKVVEAEVKMSN